MGRLAIRSITGWLSYGRVGAAASGLLAGVNPMGGRGWGVEERIKGPRRGAKRGLVGHKVPLHLLLSIDLLLELEHVLYEQVVQRLVREVDACRTESAFKEGVGCKGGGGGAQICGKELSEKFSKPKMSRMPTQNAALHTET